MIPDTAKTAIFPKARIHRRKMEVLTVYLVPVILLLASLLALKKNENSYALPLEVGAKTFDPKNLDRTSFAHYRTF